MTRRAFGSMYAEDTEAALTAWARNPGPPPEAESFVDWGTLVSGLKGFPTAALEKAGSFMDAVSAIEASGHRAVERERAAHPERFGEDQVRRIQRNKEAQAELERAGPLLRRKAEEFAANPETAHTADKVVHGLVRGMSKAVADVMLFGPIAGPAIFGADEGNTAARRLIEQEGVDPATAAKVGLTTAVVQGASVALPVVGPTVGKTIGLALAGGPASYATQEQITKQILQNADYSHLAAQHDPFDPLGLALSTAIPGVIGGLHIRSLKKQATVEDVVKHIESGGRRYGKDGELLTSHKGAQGEMQVMPGTAKDPGFGVTPARDNSPEELARVGRDYLAAMQQRYGDTDKALAAYNAGPGAVDAAVKKGGADWLTSMPDETKAYVAKANKLLGEVTVAKGAEDPAVVDAARVRVTDMALARSLPDHPAAAADVMLAADEVAAGNIVGAERVALARAYDDVLGSPQGDKFDPLVMIRPDDIEAVAISRGGWKGIGDAEVKGAGFGLVKFMWRHGEESQKPQELQVGREDILAFPEIVRRFEPAEEIQGERGRAWRVERQGPDGTIRTLVYADSRINGAEGRHLVTVHVQEGGVSDTKPLSKTKPDWNPESPGKGLQSRAGDTQQGFLHPAGQDQSGAPSVLPRPDDVGLDASKVDGAAKQEADDGADQARLKQLLDDQPDLRVKLPGSDETLSVEEALLRAHEAYDDEVGVAELLKVAAECALMNGV